MRSLLLSSSKNLAVKQLRTPCKTTAGFNSIVSMYASRCSPFESNIRALSGITRGTDLLEDSLSFSSKPKIIFDGFAPTGIDVLNIVTPKETDNANVVLTQNTPSRRGKEKQQLQTLHMNGSCIAFPHSCFLWKPQKPQEVTLESLEIVMLVDHPVELLFIGCDGVIPPRAMNQIKREFKRRSGIIVEQMTLVSTFTLGGMYQSSICLEYLDFITLFFH